MIEIVKTLTNIPKSIVGFMRSVINEMQKTEFPTKKDSYRLSNVVLIGSFVISIVLFGIDSLFVLIRTYLTNISQ